MLTWVKGYVVNQRKTSIAQFLSAKTRHFKELTDNFIMYREPPKTKADGHFRLG